jgi:hypothetical protein
MLKIILIALIISSISCQNFLGHPSDINMIEIFEGFFNGLQVFTGLDHAIECIAEDHSILTADIEKILYLVEHIDGDNYIYNLNEVVNTAFKIYYNVKDASPNCEAWKIEMTAQILNIKDYVSQNDYFKQISFHLISKLDDFKKIVNEAVEDYRNESYYKAGEKLGDAAHFYFLFDFKYASNQ